MQLEPVRKTLRRSIVRTIVVAVSEHRDGMWSIRQCGRFGALRVRHSASRLPKQTPALAGTQNRHFVSSFTSRPHHRRQRYFRRWCHIRSAPRAGRPGALYRPQMMRTGKFAAKIRCRLPRHRRAEFKEYCRTDAAHGVCVLPTRQALAIPSSSPPVKVLALPDKPSLVVLPFDICPAEPGQTTSPIESSSNTAALSCIPLLRHRA